MPQITFMNLDAPPQTATGKTFSTGCVWQGNVIATTYGGTGAGVIAGRGMTVTATSSALTFDAHVTAQGRFQFATPGSVTFTRYNGQWIPISGVWQSIPSAGVATTNANLTASTLYYVYAMMNNNVMELRLSTATHATDTNGIETKSGDTTMTLVGMASTNTDTKFQSSATGNLVVSYYNRKEVKTATPLTASVLSNSTTFVEIGSGFTGFRIGFLTWGDEQVHVYANGLWSGGSNIAFTSIGIDAAAATQCSNAWQAAVYGPLSLDLATKLSEGYHYGALVGRTTGATTYTWEGGPTAGQRCNLEVRVMG